MLEDYRARREIAFGRSRTLWNEVVVLRDSWMWLHHLHTVRRVTSRMARLRFDRFWIASVATLFLQITGLRQTQHFCNTLSFVDWLQITGL